MEVSFTYNTKSELCVKSLSLSSNIAFLSAYIRNNVKIYDNHFELNTENINVNDYICFLLKEIYDVSCVVEHRKMLVFNKKVIHYIVVSDKKDYILKDLCVVDDKGNLLDRPSNFLIDGDEEKKSYIRGVFLAKGSINDPNTSTYHLEMALDNKYEAVLVQRLLNEYLLNSKIIMRDNKYMVYIKDSEKISDFLKLVGAYKAVMYYEDVRVLHEQRNITNRLNNCEQANVDKIILTCNNQINDINIIKEKIGLDILDDKLKELCEYRLKYPESSLQELSEIISFETNKKITKSGLNHRFRKIREISDKLK